MTLGERIGLVAGWALAPAAAAGSALRGARLFHPEGFVLRASVVADAVEEPLSSLAARLAGPALVRLSNAWWRHGREWPDVLGCAIRFGAGTDGAPEAAPGAQDLLLATISSPASLALGPLRTNPHDFLANVYRSAGPYRVHGVGRLEWRALPRQAGTGGRTRRERLEQAIADGRAVLGLEARPGRRAPWRRVAQIYLVERADVDPEQLRFRPHRSGRGIEPAGFVNALRIGAYRASQAARRLRWR